MSLASIDAKGGKGKNTFNRDMKNNQAQTRYEAPTKESTYYQCDEQALEISKKALTEAKGNRNIKLPHAPVSVESLTIENCLMTYTNYDWFKLTYLKGEEVCEVHVVVAWRSWVLQGKPERYALKVEHTQQANEEMGKCVSVSTFSGKVTTDIEEKLEEQLENELIKEEKELEHEISQEEKQLAHEISQEEKQLEHEISQEEKNLQKAIIEAEEQAIKEEKLEHEISQEEKQLEHAISQEEKNLQKAIIEAEEQAIEDEIIEKKIQEQNDQREVNITPIFDSASSSSNLSKITPIFDSVSSSSNLSKITPLFNSVNTKPHNPHFDNPFEPFRTYDSSSQNSLDSSDSVRTLNSLPSDLFIANLDAPEESSNSIVKVWNKDIAGVPMKKQHQPLPRHQEPVKIWTPEDLKVVPYYNGQNFADSKYKNLQLNLPEEMKAHYFKMHSAPTQLYNHVPHKISSLLVENMNKDVAPQPHDSELQVALYNPLNIDDLAAKAKAQMEAQAQENKHETPAPVHQETKHEAPAPVHQETKHDVPAPVHQETKHDTPAPVHQETKHDTPAPVHQETQKIEVITPPTFGPGRGRVPAHNQKGKKQLFAGNDIDEDNDNEESAEDNSTSDKDIQPAMLGGWSTCSESAKEISLGVFAMLIRQNKISSVTVYSQNLVKCKKQMVNGINYTVIASFNREECFLSFYRSIKGDITLYETTHNVDGLNRCTVDYKL